MSAIEEEVLWEYTPDEPPVTTFWRQASEGTTYWRLAIPARHLPANVNALRYSDTLEADPLLRQAGDTAIWQFLGDLERTKFVARMQSAGVKILMDVDDNYTIPPPHMANVKSPWHSTVRDSFKTGGTHYSHQAHRWILPSIDGLLVSTEELANVYEPLVPAGVTICPNSVDPDDWDEVGPRETAVVGYAGSASHKYDLHIVDRALDWASRHTPLMKLGVDTSVWRWPHEEVPWTDNLADYRRSLQKIDIGLCPLKRSAWHDCKSDIKAMEYLMAGAVPIVQADSPCYRDWVGIVPSAITEKQWERVVREVVLMPVEERHSIWRGAMDFLLSRKLISTNIRKWRSCL